MNSDILVVPINHFLGEFGLFDVDSEIDFMSFDSDCESCLQSYKDHGWKIIAMDNSSLTIPTGDERLSIEADLSIILKAISCLDAIRVNFPANNIALGIDKDRPSSSKLKLFNHFWSSQITLDPNAHDYLLGYSVMRSCFQFLETDDIYWRDKLLLLTDNERAIQFADYHRFSTFSADIFYRYKGGSLQSEELARIEEKEKDFLDYFTHPKDPIPF